MRLSCHFAVSYMLAAACLLHAATVSEQIIVDQFGWRPDAVKVAVFANPVRGWNSARSYEPGATFELRNAADNATVFTGDIVSWNDGTEHEQSGDIVWWGDFTDVTTPGSYYLYDPHNDCRSFVFDIRDDIYAAILRHAGRMFYYQRCGAAVTPEHGGVWNHPACHLSDTAAARWTRRNEDDPRLRDVHGGWHDAGDFNKYVPFTLKAVWDLCQAYEMNPDAFTDTWNIPESGNGVPDILDELKWELDWMLRMQLEDGSVANRTAEDGCSHGSPETHTASRYWTEPTSWATASAIAGWAHAARLFEDFANVYPGYGDSLVAASTRSWEWLLEHPEMTPAGGADNNGQNLSCAAQGDGDRHDEHDRRLLAAVELWRTTGEERFKQWFDSAWTPISGFKQGDPPVWDPMMNGESGHSFARQAAGYQYARTPGATAAIVDNVKSALGELTSWYDQIDPGAADAYRATTWYFSWGSNHTMANWALSWLYADQLGAGAKGTERRSAEEYLHWFHGRNPLSWVYLSNMGEKGVDAGAEKSVIELYHGWFWDGSEDFDGADSRYGMAPGFVAGGPNQAYCDYSDQTACLRELMDQPPAKSYHDWNGGWNEAKHANENSWEVTEPGIYYQAAYVHLLSYFVPTATAAIRSGRFRATAPAASMRVRGGTTLYRLDGRKLDLRSGSRRLSRGVYYERAADGTVRRFVTIR